MKSSMEPDLRDLLSGWMGSDLNPERCERLLVRVREDSDFRRAFVDEIWMLGKLKAVQSSEPRWLRLEDEMGWSVRRSTDVEVSDVEESVARRLNEEGPTAWIRQPRRPNKLAAAAAVAAVAAGLGWAILSRRTEPPRVAATTAPANVAPSPALAMLLRLDAARWEASVESPPVVGGMLGSGRLQLASGRATLAMLNGVVVVMEGPADLDLVSVDQVYCRRGKLRARVPEGAEGFIVSGPDSAVVDLGTEFAVNLSPEGATRGRVFRGTVEASVLNSSGTTERSQVLHERQSFEINRSVVTIESESAGDFAEPPDLIVDGLALDDAYPQAVLDDRPWSYWRLDHLDAGVVDNQVPGGPALRAHGPVRLVGAADPGGNRCAEFVADATNQYFTPEIAWTPPNHPGYAVELWFMTEWIAHAALVGLVAPADTHHHSFLLELTSQNRLTLHKPASVRILHRVPPGPTGGDNVFSEPYYLPYRWHHLVGQMNEDQMEVYLDGHPTPPLKLASGLATPPSQLVFGRLTTIPVHSPGRSRPFHGRMDEIAVYNHPLTIDQIQHHHALRRRGRP